MARMRSPSYPSIGLEQAIEYAEKIHDTNRTNPIDREAAVRDMGFSGITGHSGKMIANLLQYGLLEKVGKGEVRISRRAVDIMHPSHRAERARALNETAFEPELFYKLHERFSDGIPSENNLRSFLVREGFSNVAVTPAVTSYLETCRFLQIENAFELNSIVVKVGNEVGPNERIEASVSDVDTTMETGSAGPEASPSGVIKETSPSERVIFTEESEPGCYLKLSAKGNVDEFLLEALEDFVKRQRKRLSKTVN